MKKLLFPVLCFTANGLLYAQDVSTAKWAAQPVTIDGAATEWHQPLNFYDSETKLLFAIANDSANIYLCFEAKDNMTEMKIMRAGMRVELDTKGRNGRSATIEFPLPPKERNEPEAAGSFKNGSDTAQMAAGGPGPQMFRQRFLTSNIMMDVKGFADGNGIIPVRGRNISVAMNWDDADNLFYEVCIPVKELLDEGYTADNLQKEITLRAEINALRGGESGSGGSGGGGMRGGGMRGGGGGMRGGGRGGMHGGGAGLAQGSGDRASLFEKTSFKQKFVLGANTQQ